MSVFSYTPLVSLHTQSAAPPPPPVGSFLLLWAGAHWGPCVSQPLLNGCSVWPLLWSSLWNRIIRATAVSDQPQFIRRERTNLNQCTLRNLSSLDSPAAAMGGGTDMCCSSYDQLFVSEMGSSIPIISFTCQSSCLVGEHLLISNSHNSQKLYF